MATPRKKYKPKRKSLPLLTCRDLSGMFLEERIAFEALRMGYASPHHFDLLVEGVVMVNHLVNGTGSQAAHMADVAHVCLLNIRDRYDRTGKLGMASDELAVMALFLDDAEDFWKRQPSTAYNKAYNYVGEWKRGIFEVET
jgi:hypothetical protein